MAPSGSSPAGERCRWCGIVFVARSGPGRPRVYCGQSCRQQHYIERRTAVASGRDPTKLVVDRDVFEQYETKRLQLRLALDDLERGAAEPSSPKAERATRSSPEELMGWIVEHAQALVSFDLK